MPLFADVGNDAGPMSRTWQIIGHQKSIGQWSNMVCGPEQVPYFGGVQRGGEIIGTVQENVNNF